MTLPKIANIEDGASDGDSLERTKHLKLKNRSGVRARAVRQNEAYLLDNLSLTNTLERCFINLGLLKEHLFGQNFRSTQEKVKEILDNLGQVQDSSTWKAFFNVLTEYGYIEVADKIRSDIASIAMAEQIEDTTSPRGRPKTPETSTLRRRLHSLERTARQWQIRAQQLEQERDMLRNHNEPKILGTQSLQRKDETRVKLGKLENDRELLSSELKLKDKGLAAWKHKESLYKNQIEQLTNRMDLMSSMIRNKDTEVESFKVKEKRYKDKLSLLHSQFEELSKKRKAQTDPSLKITKPPFSAKSPSKTLTTPGRLPALLPNQDLIIDARKPKKSPELPDIKPFGLQKSQTLKNGMVLDFNTKGLKRDTKDVAAFATTREPASRPPSLKINQPFAPKPPPVGSPDEDTPLPCVLKEKRIDRKGGEIDMERVALHVPPNSVPMCVLFSVTDTMHYDARLNQIKSCGLEEYLQPCMQVRLQPHGISFLRPVYLEMKDIQNTGSLLVYHKEVDVHSYTPWNDITSTCSPKFKKDNLVIALEHFSIVEAMKILVPAAVGAAAGMAMGYHMSLKSKADAIINKQTCAVDYHIYHKPGDAYLIVLCVEQDAYESNNNNNSIDALGIPGMQKLGSQPARFDLCDKERMYFYFSDSHKLAASLPFDLAKCRNGGQRIHVTLPSGHISVKANSLIIKRRISENIEEQQLCSVKMFRDKSPLSSSSDFDSDFVDGSISEIELKHEHALRKCRLKIVKQLDVKDIMDYLRQEDIFNEHEQEELYAITTRRDRASVFVDRLSAKGPKAFDVFCVALKEGYDWLVDDLKTQLIDCG